MLRAVHENGDQGLLYFVGMRRRKEKAAARVEAIVDESRGSYRCCAPLRH